ncbi:hypothetical protein ACP3TJ_03155 [Desulforudis sp. 1088]|uniref:hypothetical protein n=1 Tax=unclassified Candidatus Desulforudis TaxID=2635950 RepID=UPI0034965629
MIIVAVGTFTSTVFFSFLTEVATRRLANIIVAALLLILIISVGVFFDILGTAVTAAREAPFHAKAAKKVFGAQQGVFLIRNADKVANFSNDIVGDIAGTLSGALGISLIVQLATMQQGFNIVLANVLITAGIASLTVSGKLLGKRLAINRANEVVFLVARVLASMERIRRPLNPSNPSGHNKVKNRSKVWRR